MYKRQVVDAFDDCSISLAKIETHFFYNDCFIEENQIIKNIDSIKNIPCHIVHGRYDIVLCTRNRGLGLVMSGFLRFSRFLGRPGLNGWRAAPAEKNA